MLSMGSRLRAVLAPLNDEHTLDGGHFWRRPFRTFLLDEDARGCWFLSDVRPGDQVAPLFCHCALNFFLK